MDESEKKYPQSLMFLRLQYLIFAMIGIVASIFFSRNQFQIFEDNSVGLKTDYISELQRRTDILEYFIDLKIEFDNKSIESSVRIKGVIKGSSANQVQLNFSNEFNIKSVIVDDAEALYTLSSDHIVITAKNPITDTFNLVIQYSGRPKNLGMWGFSFAKLNGSPVVYTINEPQYASTWFPCNDRPDDKAMVSVSINVKNDYMGLSNGALVATKHDGERVTYLWRSNYPIASYLTAVYASKYIEIKDKYVSILGDSIPLSYFVFPKDSIKAMQDFSAHPQYLKVFEELFGPYPYSKDKYSVAAFLWTSGAMENQTITGFAYNMITGTGMFSDVLLHELAHQWWGNSVSPKSWSDIWLNEGFASYSEALYYEKVYGKEALAAKMIEFKEFDQTESMLDPEYIFSKTVYHKGAWVIHMLREEMGDSLFFSFLKDYQKKYRYSNASTADLQASVEKYCNKSYQQFFDQWIFQGKGMIELSYSGAQKNVRDFYSYSLNLIQEQAGYPAYKFPLEVKLLGESASKIEKIYVNLKEQKFEFNVPFKVTSIIIDPESKLLMSAIASN